jgi:hypothetical protein
MDLWEGVVIIKRVLKVLLIGLAIVYVLYSPNSAAETLRMAVRNAVGGVLTLGDSAAKFFDAFLRH